MSLSPVSRFFWFIVFLLSACFAAWYYMAVLMTMPVNWLSGMVMTWLFPEWIDVITQQGHAVEVVTLFTPSAQNVDVPEGLVGHVAFDINVLKYSYGIPLFTALILATPGEESTKWTNWIIGLIILYLAQTWGVCFEILKTISLSLGPDIAAQTQTSTFQKELIALGYQLGYLILPAVTPLAMWIGFSQEFISTLVPGFSKKLEKDSH